jgi:hypothetical protein
MTCLNPTPVRIGMTGTFDGTQYRVVGRLVMGVVEDGEIYDWQEFNLETGTGKTATLVYERTERGGEWRFFTMFEPQYPITAEDAATKRVGDPINLDGTDLRVTLVEQSRVYHIEGKAPEGVETGDHANYFNAEGDAVMDVVSWTGQEVECYHGATLSYSVVAEAFNLRRSAFSSLFQRPGYGGAASNPATKVVLGLIVAVIASGGFVLFFPRTRSRPPAVIRTSAPPAIVKVGSAGRLKGTDYRVQSHALVEVALQGRAFRRHEYGLATGFGDKALLVCGSKPGVSDWVLYTPFHPAEPLTPHQAGAIRLGQTVNVDGVVAKVSELCQSTTRLVEAAEADAPSNGDVMYCFAGSGDYYQLLVRWNSYRIEFFQGQVVAEAHVVAAFKSQPR